MRSSLGVEKQCHNKKRKVQNTGHKIKSYKSKNYIKLSFVSYSLFPIFTSLSFSPQTLFCCFLGNQAPYYNYPYISSITSYRLPTHIEMSLNCTCPAFGGGGGNVLVVLEILN